MRAAAAAAAEVEAAEQGLPAAGKKQPCRHCLASGRLFTALGLKKHILAKHTTPLKRRGAVCEALQSTPKRHRLQ